jgi:ribosome recycling factor
MSEGFLARAKEQAQHGLSQGKQKVDDMQQQRAGNDLLRKLGAAYYGEKKGLGTEQATETALAALEAHIAEHGDGFLRG